MSSGNIEAMIPFRLIAVFIFALGALSLSGCKNPREELSSRWEKFLNRVVPSRSGKISPEKSNPQKSDLSEPVDPRAAQVHAELLSEMYQVVFLSQPQDRARFGSFVDSLNQGASFEGIYNGFVHSSGYRSLEEKFPGSSLQALSFFVDEILKIQSEMKQPTEFNEASALPLARPVEMVEDTGAVQGVGEALNFGKKKSSKAIKEDARQRLTRIFKKSSVYTLKRVLGDEALQLILEKQADREKLASWYGLNAARWAEMKVDFGLSQRNQADARFHRDWAMTAEVDRLSWEVLNRLHRLVNAKNTMR